MDNKELLGSEEINELIKKAQAGDLEAKKIVVENNLRLISSIAAKFNSTTSSVLEFSDLQQEGYFGLAKAIDKFDVTKGFKFSTYATWWIRQSIQRAVSDNNRSIRIPIHIQEDLQRVKKAKKILEQELGREPSISDIYDKIKIDISWYDKIVDHDFFCILVDMLVNEGYSYEDIDVLDIEEAIMEDIEFNEEAEIILKKIVKYLAMNKNIPNKETILGKVALSKEKIAEILSYEGNITSLDQKVSDDSDTCFGDSIASTSSIEEDLDKKWLEEGLERAIDEVYGKQVAEILENIKKYEIQIAYLTSKLGKDIDFSSELVSIEEDSTMDENNKSYIKEVLAVLVKSKNKNPKVSLNVQSFIDDITEKKLKMEKKSENAPKAELLNRRYGICGYEKETLEQLGKRYNLSRERIRQIEKKIISGRDNESRLLREKILEYCNLDRDSF